MTKNPEVKNLLRRERKTTESNKHRQFFPEELDFALLRSLQENRINDTRLLLSQGATIDYESTPLMDALSKALEHSLEINNVDDTCFLLKKGAVPNFEEPEYANYLFHLALERALKNLKKNITLSRETACNSILEQIQTLVENGVMVSGFERNESLVEYLNIEIGNLTRITNSEEYENCQKRITFLTSYVDTSLIDAKYLEHSTLKSIEENRFKDVRFFLRNFYQDDVPMSVSQALSESLSKDSSRDFVVNLIKEIPQEELRNLLLEQTKKTEISVKSSATTKTETTATAKERESETPSNQPKTFKKNKVPLQIITQFSPTH